MRHMLAQFGPCLKWPWTKLEAPELTETLIDRMVEGTQAQAAGRSIRELERLRDDYLVAIQQVLRQYNIGAGATLRSLEARLYQDAASTHTAQPAAAGKPPRLLDAVVRSEWVDYNRHMSDFRYSQMFGDAMDALFRRAGAWPRMQLMTAMGCVASCESAGPSQSSRTTQLGKNIIPSTRLPIASAISSNACSAASKIGDASQPAMTSSQPPSLPPSCSPPLSSGGPD